MLLVWMAHSVSVFLHGGLGVLPSANTSQANAVLAGSATFFSYAATMNRWFPFTETGLAIVASDAVGAAAELVRDGVNGGAFTAGRLQALTEKLLLATDPERIETLKAGSNTVLEEWRRIADPVQGLREALHAGPDTSRSPAGCRGTSARRFR